MFRHYLPQVVVLPTGQLSTPFAGLSELVFHVGFLPAGSVLVGVGPNTEQQLNPQRES